MAPKLVPVNDKRPALHHSGKRDPSQIRWVVLHSTEGGPNAAGAVSWFQNEECQGSTHLVVGMDGAFRCLPDDVEPWAAPGANLEGLHIEFAGNAHWHPGEWSKFGKTFDEAAALVAEWCYHYDIPAEFLDASKLHDPASKGVTTHAEVTEAFKKGDHWDPGKGFPMDSFLASVAKCLADYPAKPEPTPEPEPVHSTEPAPAAEVVGEAPAVEEAVPATLAPAEVAAVAGETLAAEAATPVDAKA
jgi:hypothetical protein